MPSLRDILQATAKTITYILPATAKTTLRMQWSLLVDIFSLKHAGSYLLNPGTLLRLGPLPYTSSLFLLETFFLPCWQGVLRVVVQKDFSGSGIDHMLCQNSSLLFVPACFPHLQLRSCLDLFASGT